MHAADETSVFVDALLALAELLRDEQHEPTRDRESREVTVEGEDRAALFAAWLEELSFLAETQGFVPQRVDDLALEPQRLRARVSGRRGAPPHLVKQSR